MGPIPRDGAFTVTCWVASVVVLLAFGLMAVRLARKHRSQDLETFITARRSQPLLRVAWSFYAGSIGCWAIFLPASYPSFGGWISILTYAVSTGLPLLLIAEFGYKILKRAPDVISLNDFAGRMYGRPVQLFVVALSLVNMSVALISEYTAIGDLFEHYVGGPRVAIILLVGGITAVYTASGGLLVSILTDQAQAFFSLLLILVASIYLACNFREPLRDPLPQNLGANYAGLSSIFSLPISLLSSAIYSEAFWQRVWSAEDKTSLKKGALLGFGLTTTVIAFFGFVGFLGQWAGLPALDEHNNLAFFVPFSDAAAKGGRAAGSPGAVGIRVLMVLLAATMNESAVDSLQNAIVSTISSSFLAGRPVGWSRALVFLVNAPIVLVALQGYALLDLFLALNVITTTSTFPLLSALWLPGVSGATVLRASATSLVCTCLLGVAVEGGDIARGIRWVFTSRLNLYDYRIFVVAALTSVLATCLSWFVVDARCDGVRLLAERREEQRQRRAAALEAGEGGVGRVAAAGESAAAAPSCGGGSGSGGGGGEGDLKQPFLVRWCLGASRQQRQARRQQQQREQQQLPAAASLKASVMSLVLGSGSGGSLGGSNGGRDTGLKRVDSTSPLAAMSPDSRSSSGGSLVIDELYDDDDTDDEAGRTVGAGAAGGTCSPPTTQRIELRDGGEGFGAGSGGGGLGAAAPTTLPRTV